MKVNWWKVRAVFFTLTLFWTKLSLATLSKTPSAPEAYTESTDFESGAIPLVTLLEELEVGEGNEDFLSEAPSERGGPVLAASRSRSPVEILALSFAATKHLLSKNEFRVNRSLKEALLLFSKVKKHVIEQGEQKGERIYEVQETPLKDFLLRLRAGSKILMGGSGDSVLTREILGERYDHCAFMVGDDLMKSLEVQMREVQEWSETFKKGPLEDRPQFYEVSYKVNREARARLKEHPEVRSLRGRFFHEIPQDFLLREARRGEQIPFDLIVDLYGILTYTPLLSDDFNRYLSLLKVGGRILIQTFPSMPTGRVEEYYRADHGLNSRTSIIDPKTAKSTDLRGFLEEFSEGLRVRSLESVFRDKDLVLIVEKVKEGASVASLRLVETKLPPLLSMSCLQEVLELIKNDRTFEVQ